jgi:hypothetical protein
LERKFGIFNEAAHETGIHGEEKVVRTAATLKNSQLKNRSNDIAGRLDSLEEQVMIDIVI